MIKISHRLHAGLRKAIPFIFVTSLFFSFFGCTIKLGVRFNENNVDLIERGVTTKSQIKDLIGKPASIGLKDGNKLWTYIFAEVPLIGSRAQGTILSVEFDEKGKVKTFTYVPY